MPVLTTFEIHGDADELMEVKETQLDPISREIAPRNGLLAHMAVKTPKGIKVFNVWETLEGSERTATEFQARAKDLGIERKPENWEHWELAQFFSMKEVLPVGV